MLSPLSADATSVTPEGNPTTATAIFKGVDFDQQWISKNDVTVSVTLGARTMNLTVTAKNTSDHPEPMGLGWHPRFVIPSGNREAVELRLPVGQQLDIPDNTKQLPSGKFEQPGASIARFQGHPWPIGQESVDASLVHLRASGTDSGPSAEIRDPQSGVGLRMTALSNSTRELRVTSPDSADYVGLGMQSNIDDPLGKEWLNDEAIQILLPGQTAEWKISLEIFPVASPAAAH